MSIGLISELDAVNRILAASGDSPVLEFNDEYIQSNLARTELQEASRELQAQGWFFNEETQVRILPDINTDEITLGANVITMTPNRYEQLVQRGQRVYNLADNTYKFPKGANGAPNTGRVVDLIYMLEWQELPQVARKVMINMATINFINNFVGDNTLLQVVAGNLQESMVKLMDADFQSRGTNMLRNTRSSNIAFTNRL